MNNNNISCENFMNENFLEKFIKYLMRKSEIKNFLSKLLAPFILTIEEYCTDLDLSFYEFENEENNKEENEIFMDFIDIFISVFVSKLFVSEYCSKDFCFALNLKIFSI